MSCFWRAYQLLIVALTFYNLWEKKLIYIFTADTTHKQCLTKSSFSDFVQSRFLNCIIFPWEIQKLIDNFLLLFFILLMLNLILKIFRNMFVLLPSMHLTYSLIFATNFREITLNCIRVFVCKRDRERELNRRNQDRNIII